MRESDSGKKGMAATEIFVGIEINISKNNLFKINYLKPKIKKIKFYIKREYFM